MADEKLNTGPAENISPEAAEPITTPEQAAASEPRQEQTGLPYLRRSRKGGNSRNAGSGSSWRNTAAHQYGGVEKAAP